MNPPCDVQHLKGEHKEYENKLKEKKSDPAMEKKEVQGEKQMVNKLVEKIKPPHWKKPHHHNKSITKGINSRYIIRLNLRLWL